LRRAPAAIAEQCPECVTAGLMACGTADVAYGNRFARTALRGKPPRGYLMTFVMTAEEFRTLARRSAYDALVSTLRDRFRHARLVVLEAHSARVLPSAATVDVTFPQPLHACLSDRSKPWGCCVGAECRHECCEKGLGSPSVTLRWHDPASDEILQFTFHHMPGYAHLERRTAKRQVAMYYCLTDAAVAVGSMR
jgi:hypothetical protein